MRAEEVEESADEVDNLESKKGEEMETESLKTRRTEEAENRRMIDVTRDKPLKVTVRVLVPVRDHPKFNFVGKLLGPKGNSLKRLQENTMTKMAILGRGSMKNKLKEEELRTSGDPKFSHLREDLHVEITAFAPAAEAHARIACALSDLRPFLVPDHNDDIRQEQMWEMQALKEVPERDLDSAHTPEVHFIGTGISESDGTERRSPGPPAQELRSCSAVVPSQPQAFPGAKAPSFVSTSFVGTLPGRKRASLCTDHSTSPIKRTILSVLTKGRTPQLMHIPGPRFIH